MSAVSGPGSGIAGTALDDDELEALRRELDAIRLEMVSEAAAHATAVEAVHPDYRASARNLLHYLALRRRDRRPLQLRLAARGLSSLGRAEASALASVDAVLALLYRVAGRSWEPPVAAADVDFAAGHRLLDAHADALLGPAPAGRSARIMVTMPSEAAADYGLVHDLLAQGMNGMRINCAHDDTVAWSGMIDNLRRAEAALGRNCKVIMDLAGPKLRTGPLAPGPAVRHIKPVRDAFGRVTAPARVRLAPLPSAHALAGTTETSLPLPGEWLARLRPGDTLGFRDARGARRTLVVIDVGADGCWAEAHKSAYVTPGTVLRRETAGDAVATTGPDRWEAAVGPWPPQPGVLVLRPGDRLTVTRDARPGRPASLDSRGLVESTARIGCTLPEVFDDVRPGEAIWFDDGRIGGGVEAVEADRVQVHVTQAPLGGGKLRADKGINLPQSDLSLSAVTAQDVDDLAFVAEHADIVELSFASGARDVEILLQQLERLSSARPAPAIVLKIETRRGFEHLPEMLLAAMRWPRCGVMIARGDLAVECGFERLAEVQEEILWICEAAHLPVIWATQVLETLAQHGLPSRAEISDAAMSHRAECVMLNKGPHVLSAVKVLDGILRRMQAHESKKRAMLRELRLAHALASSPRSNAP